MDEKFITALKVTSRDKWLTERIGRVGDSIFTHPNYLYLKGNKELIDEWIAYLKRPEGYRRKILDNLVEDIKKNGQLESIVIDKEMRILNGHKRTSVMAFLGHEKIKVKYQ